MATGVRLAVAVGGAVGTLGRVGLALAVPRPPVGFPWATLVVNVTGTVALAVLSRRVTDPRLRAGLLTGALGAWTTVSTFGVEVADLVRGGAVLLGLGYATVSLAVGVAAAALGAGAATGTDPAVRP